MLQIANIMMIKGWIMDEIKNIQCSVCGEYIAENSEICPFCNEQIKKVETEQETKTVEVVEQKTPNNKTLILVVVLICLLF